MLGALIVDAALDNQHFWPDCKLDDKDICKSRKISILGAFPQSTHRAQNPLLHSFKMNGKYRRGKGFPMLTPAGGPNPAGLSSIQYNLS